ncbi:MAG: hypothetical protein WBJ41_05810, partial [Chromatiaceae bacterium]
MAKKSAEPKKPAINPKAPATPAPPVVVTQAPAALALPPEQPVPPVKVAPRVPKEAPRVVQGGTEVVHPPLALDLSELIATAPELPSIEKELVPA